jgi:hypothetical protein
VFNKSKAFVIYSSGRRRRQNWSPLSAPDKKGIHQASQPLFTHAQKPLMYAFGDARPNKSLGERAIFIATATDCPAFYTLSSLQA